MIDLKILVVSRFQPFQKINPNGFPIRLIGNRTNVSPCKRYKKIERRLARKRNSLILCCHFMIFFNHILKNGLIKDV